MLQKLILITFFVNLDSLNLKINAFNGNKIYYILSPYYDDLKRGL